MHRQGKGQSARRVRLQGLDRHPRYQPKGGQFVLHAKALHDNTFDGHTLKPAVADIERNAGVDVKRIHVDKGYRGHDNWTGSASLSSAKSGEPPQRSNVR
jgi:hypothetical protein